MISLFDILIVAAVLGFAYWGWLEGLERASVAGLELFGCITFAVIFHETLAGFLFAGAELVVGEWASQAWSVLLAFALLAWGSFALLRWQLHGGPADDEEDEAAIDPLADRLGGAVAGGFGGAVLVGGGLVTLSMVPFLAGLKPGDTLLLDVGKMTLRAAGAFAGGWEEGRSVPLWGEPPSRASVASALLTSEPWFDADDDGSCTEADRYRDVDDSGTFTPSLYFEDLDRDGLRRIGLVDKYAAGRWDGELFSQDRPRPKPKAVATPAAGSKPTPGAKPTPGRKPAPGPKPEKPTVPENQAKPTPPGTKAEPAAGDGPETEPAGPAPERLPGDDF
jgi:hypothetical protein